MRSVRKFFSIQNLTWLTAIALLLTFTVIRVTEKGTLTSISPPAVIGYSNSPSWWPWIIVEERDLLKRNGINAELKWYDNYSDSVGDLNTGFIDGNSQMIGDAMAASPKAIKGKVGVLLNTYSDGEDKLIVRNGISKIDDLKGKKIIAESATVNNHLLSLILASGKSNISTNDLEIVNLETGSASAAFAVNDEIDGVITFPPYSITAFRRDGSHELISSKAFPREIARMLVLTKEIAQNQPELIEELTKVWFQALNFMQKHPDEANKIIAKHIGIQVDRLQLFQNQIQIVKRSEATKTGVLAQSVRENG